MMIMIYEIVSEPLTARYKMLQASCGLLLFEPFDDTEVEVV